MLSFSDEDVFHGIAGGFDTMDHYVNNTVDELKEGTLGTYNDAVDEVMELYYRKHYLRYNRIPRFPQGFAHLYRILCSSQMILLSYDFPYETTTRDHGTRGLVVSLGSSSTAIKG